MARFDDIDLVRRDYSDPTRLEERFKAWREYHDPDMLALIMQAVVEESVGCVLEVGCGDGRFSQQMHEELGVRVVAMDFSPGMAAQAALRGLDVQIGDIQLMPWPDAHFDVVVANWMLYHVPDLDRGLDEIKRVLRPGGRLVASTMANGHMREMWDMVRDGEHAPELEFSTDNGVDVLRRHFDEVEQRSMAGHATFPDRDAAVAHIRTTLTRSHLADLLPEFDGPLRVTTSNSMFVARKEHAADGSAAAGSAHAMTGARVG